MAYCMAIDQAGQTAGHLIARSADHHTAARAIPVIRWDSGSKPIPDPATAPGQQPDFRFVKDECVDSE
ncbi:hypothetical protein P3T35_006422 [Kitasatospora sp. GP30]|nr:hypothetical protein [Kitasatospora sp. GP30]